MTDEGERTDGGVIRVAIVDDHPTLREGAAALIDQEPDLHVTGLAGSLAEAEALVTGADPPDVVVLDIRLGEERGLDMLAAAAARGNQPAVVIWTAYDLPQYAAYAMRTGASGFVLKTAPTRELLAAIRGAAGGAVHFSRRPGLDVEPLSDREREIVSLLVAGLSNDEIAVALDISARSVEAHLTKLYQRFEVQSRSELAVRAVREAWLDIPTT